VKVAAVAVASCSAAPLKASRRRSSKKSKGNTDETSSSAVHLEKLSRKKTKKAVKKITIAEARRVPSAFDDDIIVEPSRKGFVSFLWPDLRFNVCEHCTLGSENEFVDVETFSDDVAEVRKEVTTPVAAVTTDKVDVLQPPDPQDEASPKFTRELEMTVHRGEDPAHEVPLVETREDLPEDQDPSPSMIAFNKSFGTCCQGELLSVGYEEADARDGTSRLLTLWNSSKIVDETGEGNSKQASPPLIGTPDDLGKQPSTSSQKNSSGSAPPSRVTVEMLSRKGS
jgi:hypothetical protein